MDANVTKRLSEQYRQAVDNVEDIIVDVMCTAYLSVTGRHAGDRLREALHEAVRFNT